MQIAPPGIADETLASEGETGKRFDIARFTGESGEKPSLCLGGKRGPHPSPERSLGTGETFVDPQSRIQSDNRMAADLMQEQKVKDSGDLQCHLGLDWRDVFGPKFPATRPQVISRVTASEMRMLTRSTPQLPR